MTEKKKINWLLILQGWAMLWVVIGHSYLGEMFNGPYLENLFIQFAYSFHMPLFIMISGYLFYMTRIAKTTKAEGVNTYASIIWDKFKRLLIPGFVFSILAFIVKFIFAGEVSRQVSVSASDIAHMYLYPLDNPLRELWFIAVLMWLFVVYPLWKFTLHKKWTAILTLVILAVLHFINIDVELLCIGRACKYAVWFYAGLIVSKYDIVNRFVQSKSILTLAAGTAIYCLGIFTSPFITKIGGILFSIGLALLLDKYLPKTFFTFRNYTYQIFLIGIFAQIFVKIMYRHFGGQYYLMFVICILMGVYVPVAISKIIEKINWKPLSMCVGLK